MESEFATRFRFGRPSVLAGGVIVLAFSTARLWPGGTDLPVFEAVGGVAVALLCVSLWFTRTNPPLWLALAVPVGCDLLVALLRQAQGGSTSGYSPLALVPVVWTGLVLGRRGVLVISACTTLLFALPIVIVGPPLYPDNGWRGVLLWSLISLFVGLGGDRVMRAEQEQIETAEARARELDRLAETQNAIATSAFDLDAVLRTVVQEARRLTSADAGVVEIPHGDDLVYRAVAGTATAHLGLRLPAAGAISGLAVRTGRTLLCEDSETDDRVDRAACRRVGARSLVVVPLRHDAQTAGVLKVYSGTPDAFRPEHVRVLTLLADMIGTALARAALLEKLQHLALTDELTGLPNRRNWYERLEHALARARRSRAPLSVVVLDLNGFKAGQRPARARRRRPSAAHRRCVLVLGAPRQRRPRPGRRRRVRGHPGADRRSDGRGGGRAARAEPHEQRRHSRHGRRHLGETGRRGLARLPRRRGYVRPEERTRCRYAVLSPTGHATPVPPMPQ